MEKTQQNSGAKKVEKNFSSGNVVMVMNQRIQSSKILRSYYSLVTSRSERSDAMSSREYSCVRWPREM